MKLWRCTAENFGSYASLELDLSDIGLSIVQGPTGSGKSTIPDLPCWILYGITARDCAADEVRSWYSPQDPTIGTLEVETHNGKITVTRIRGKGSQNDLYWVEEAAPDVMVRGKDLSDTQKKLSARLGVDSDLYITASYFHEFAESGQFFTLKAKDRRGVFEKVASLDLPAKIAKAAVEAKKTTKAEIVKRQSVVDSKTGEIKQLTASIANAARHSAEWDVKRMQRYEELKAKAQTFEQDKQDQIKTWEETQRARIAKIEAQSYEFQAAWTALSPVEGELAVAREQLEAVDGKTCDACGGPKNAAKAKALRSKVGGLEQKLRDANHHRERIEGFAAQVKELKQAAHPYGKLINTYDSAAEAVSKETNPFLAQIAQMQEAETAAQDELYLADDGLLDCQYRYSALEQVYDLSSDLRGALLQKAVKDIQDNTNRILETYFDGEIRVEFALSGDSLDVQIQKSGYPCVYKQLSKGQRQMLKLSFVVSVMKAASNRAGIHFQNLWFDEALDGLSSDLKVKSFGLFSELETEHSSVVLIDHAPEFQALFSKRYFVAMSEDRSEITLDEG